MLYIFDKDEKLLEIIEDYQDDNYKRILNGEISLEFKCDILNSNNIIKENKVGYFDDDDGFQLFIIKEVEDTIFEDNVKYIYCLHDYYSLRNTVITDKRLIDGTCQQAVEKALEGTDYKVGEIANFDNENINFYYISSLAAINSVLETFGGEIAPRFEFDEYNNIANKYIDIKYRLGKDTGLRFTYDTNIRSLKRKILDEDHYNVLYGRGASLPITDEEGNETGGYSRLIDFADIENSEYNKPLGQKYVEDTESIERWGRLEGIYENTNITDAETLLEKTWEKLQQTKEPKINYEIEAEDIRNIEGFEHYKVILGDSIIVLDEEYKINIESRILEINKSKKNKTINLTLGEITANISEGLATDPTIKDDDSSIKEDDFPDVLPEIPTITIEREGYATVTLSWTFESKTYYTYVLYASQIENFVPSDSDIVFQGKSSTFIHETNFGETWYYRLRVKNSHGNYTDYSEQVSATTFKIKDGTDIFENAAIGSALIGSLNADVINSGKISGTYIDARNLTVSDSEGNVVLSINPDGEVQNLTLYRKEAGNVVGKIETNVNGIYIYDRDGNLVSYFTPKESFSEKLTAQTVVGENIIMIANETLESDFYIVSEDTIIPDDMDKYYYYSLQPCIDYIRTQGRYLSDNVTINIEEGLSLLESNLYITDFVGDGSITFNMLSGSEITLLGSIVVDCEVDINIVSGEKISDIRSVDYFDMKKRGFLITNKEPIIKSYGCNNVTLRGLRLRSYLEYTGCCVEAHNGSTMLIDSCDLNNFYYAGYVEKNAEFNILNSCGTVASLSYGSSGGRVFISDTTLPQYTASLYVQNNASNYLITVSNSTPTTKGTITFVEIDPNGEQGGKYDYGKFQTTTTEEKLATLLKSESYLSLEESTNGEIILTSGKYTRYTDEFRFPNYASANMGDFSYLISESVTVEKVTLLFTANNSANFAGGFETFPHISLSVMDKSKQDWGMIVGADTRIIFTWDASAEITAGTTYAIELTNGANLYDAEGNGITTGGITSNTDSIASAAEWFNSLDSTCIKNNEYRLAVTLMKNYGGYEEQTYLSCRNVKLRIEYVDTKVNIDTGE